ncbi:relaxase/mobilization nuclease domain-containing protein [Escherichia coli]|nr:relaxase/mobilization nuclease domain-containing protein [Escherichia coli]
MIVKFHAGEKVVAVVRLITCWGRERNREGRNGASGVIRKKSGNSSMPRHLRRNTRPVFCRLRRKNCHREDVKKVMASFERVLMPGLEKNQYSILWVEHRDKGRLELNFVIPNMELQTGKRLQPYYDRADRPRIDALADAG